MSVNPHIPKFISEAPWYAEDENNEGDVLAHQRDRREKVEPEWYDRGKRKQPAATKYRRGACTNCGAMTHKARDCLERPRKKGAKYTNKDIQADDEVRSIVTTYDSKRDRWNGYDAADYKEVVEEFEREKQERANDDEYEDDDDVDKEMEMPATEKSKSMRTMQQKPGYLDKLYDDSVVYNPKTRTMHDETGRYNERGLYERALTGKGEEYHKMRSQLEEMAESGGEAVNYQANPTAALLKVKKAKQDETQAQEMFKRDLLERYGVADEDSSVKTTELAATATATTEAAPASAYSSTNTLGKVKSKYEEDVHPGNHTSVWGSYWVDRKWGYSCCHSTIKKSYCLGGDGTKKETG